MKDPSRAVFLSYASQDAEAARRICEALQAFGIEVWFDQSELRGGDAWDRQIRKQIRDCALFIPIISANSQARLEGYFRLEWRLAVERTHLMADRKTFLVPVVIDDTKDRQAEVPDPFLAVHWTRLPDGETPREFCERIVVLLTAGDGPAHAFVTRVPAYHVPPRFKRWRWAVIAVIGALVLQVGGWQAWRLMTPKAPARAAPTAAAFAPPPHSIAVLPFVNMSGDKEQEYFSEGLTEELLNSLSRLSELQVAARTSSFSFQGEHPDIATVAHKLNVGAVLEGSVRRSAHTVRITAQLVNGVTGFHLWSQTYDRDLGDVLKLQTDIANAVATALKVTLLGDVAAKIELGGTRNPEAFDSYLRATKTYNERQSEKDLQAAIAGYTESIRLDPHYALAYAYRSLAFASIVIDWAKGPAVRDFRDNAQSDARQAIAVAPGLAEGHLALAGVLASSLEFIKASQECELALGLAPSNSTVLVHCGLFAVLIGHTEAGLASTRRSVALDPLNPQEHFTLGQALSIARRYGEAIVALTDAKALAPKTGFINGWLGYAYYRSGNLQSARAACGTADEAINKRFCFALVYEKLGLHADAESMLASLRGSFGDDFAVWYALIYAEWGDTARALDSLEKAMHHHNPYLFYVKADPSFDSLRKEPRFQAIERALKFPD